MGHHLVVGIRVCVIPVDSIHEAAVLWLAGGTGVCAGGGGGCGRGRPTSVVAVHGCVCVVLGLSPGGVIPSDAERHACRVCVALSRCRLFTERVVGGFCPGERVLYVFVCGCCVCSSSTVDPFLIYSGDRRGLSGRGGAGLV